MRPLSRSAWAFLFALFFVLVSIIGICVLPASAANYDPGYNYNLFKLSEVSFSSRLSNDSSDIVSSTTSNAVTGWFPVQYDKYYSFTALYNGQRLHYISGLGSFPDIARINIKCSDGSVIFYNLDSTDAFMSDYYSTGAFRIPVENAVEMRIQFNTSVAGDDLAASRDTFAVFEPMIVEGDSAAEAFSNSKNFKYIDGDAAPYTYSVVYDGYPVINFSTFEQSCVLDLVVNTSGFNISVDGYEEDHYYSDSVYNSTYQKFAGLSYQGDEEYADYTVGNSYEITLTPSNPTLNLTSVFKHSLYVDPAGGIWNNSSDVSVIWDYFGNDYDQIYNPTREGYMFDGWTFTGSGDFSSVGDPPYTYTFGNADGYLSAKWVIDPSAQVYTSTIIIDGTSYVFSAIGASPNVELNVTETGCEISCGTETETWTYLGSGVFMGLSDSATATDPLVFTGSSFSVVGSSGSNVSLTLYSVSETIPDVPDVYSSTITIDGTPYVFTDTTEQPAVTLTVTSNGATLAYGSQSYTHVFSGSGTYSGLSFVANGSASFSIGQTYPLSAGDHTLYSCVTSAPSIYFLEAGQWECKSLIMTGEYIELPAWPSGLGSVPFSFVSSGQTFSSMSVGTYLPTSQAQLLYGSSAAYRYPLGDLSGGFTNAASAFVYLASDQVVPKEFYDWFTASFNRISDSQVEPTFTTTVNIYDSSGYVLLHTVTYSDYYAPIVTLSVLESGCTLTFRDQSSSWAVVSGEFYGFNLKPNSNSPFYQSSLIYNLPGGGKADVVLDLYVVDSISTGDSPDVSSGIVSKFVNSLIVPVMAFFNVEFIPGFSFGKIATVAFVLGLVFWFLKVSK